MTEIIENNVKEYAFVLDVKGKKLAPTNINKAWILIRKQKAVLIQKYPMVIQLKREINDTELDDSVFVSGIDDGSIYVGVSIVQKCKTKNKVIFKGTIEQRQDVKHLMDVRRGYRKYHRQHKRYREARFNNRSASRRKERVVPSIKQKRDATLRVIRRLTKYINITEYHLEDVAIDIRALTEGHKLYSWQYQKSNRLDENIRKAVILRDSCKCMECGKSDCMLEVHHIIPKRIKGADTISNLITLCEKCHDKTEDKEESFITKYQKIIDGVSIRFDYAQHVMQGKNYLRKELTKLGKLVLTTGGDTANKRIDWGIEKNHSNDAVVIANLDVDVKDFGIKDWIIKLMRKKYGKDKKVEECMDFRHRDLIQYTKKNGESYKGYITSLMPLKNQLSFTTLEGKELKRYGIKPCKLLWRFSKIYWL